MQLVEALGADDDGGDHGFGQQPGERDARRAAVVRLGDGSDDVEDLPGAFFIDERKVELGAAGIRGLLVFAAEFAGKQAAGERAPDQQADVLVFQQRDDLALQVAAGDGVVGLQRIEAGQILNSEMPSALAIFQAGQLEQPM